MDELILVFDVDVCDSFMVLLKEVVSDSIMIFVSYDNVMECYFDCYFCIFELSFLLMI